MKIRIKYQNGQWWAYFNGHPNSWFHSTELKDMCEAIAAMWPKREQLTN